jgi:uncharacterized protein
MARFDGPSLAARYTAFIRRRAGLVLFLATLVAAGAVHLASRLELRTAFTELLPSDDPGIKTLARTEARVGGLSLLLVGIRSPDHEANVRYAEALAGQFRALPKEMVELVTYHVRDLKDFFEANRWLYLKEADLETIRDRLRKEIARRKNPLLVDLGEDESVAELKARLGKADRLGGRFPSGYFTERADGPGEKYLWLAVLPPGGIFVEGANEKIYNYARELIRRVDPGQYHPRMEAEVTGPIANAVASREAVERDVVSVTAVCVVLVLLSIGLYFRRLRSLPLVGLPAITGTIMAFALAELATGHLNSSTAFLGSIILGNGINYAILLVSRYQEERARGAGLGLAIERAISGNVRGTLVAAICSSAAYASLMLTRFRGFSQFGLMGSTGVLFCWIATFTILPALIQALDGRFESRRATRAPLEMAFVGPIVTRHSRLLLVASGIVTLLAVIGLRHFLAAPFEYNFSKLNTSTSPSAKRQAFNQNQDDLFGRWPSPNVVLADDIREVEPIKAALRRQDDAQPGDDVLGDVITIYDLLPGPPEVQRRKLALLEEIRRLTQDKALELLEPDERKDLDSLAIPADLRELGPMDLPPLARRPFTEIDGSVGRVVLVYPSDNVSYYNGEVLLRMAKVMQYIHLEATPERPAKVIEASGSPVVFGAMIRSVLHDGPIATVASLLAVLLLTLLVMRPLPAAITSLFTLLLGVVWMVGAAGWAEVKITFLNFIALPITFGIGAEYAINVVARYRQEGSMEAAVVSTGSAVALCSWTTIVGYGSLLAARNRALQGFGAMAILGEITCLVAALFALPSLVLVYGRLRERGRRGGAPSAP